MMREYERFGGDVADVIMFPKSTKTQGPVTEAKGHMPSLMHALGHSTEKLNRYVSANMVALIENLHRIDAVIETLEDGPVKCGLRDQSRIIRSTLAKLSA